MRLLLLFLILSISLVTVQAQEQCAGSLPPRLIVGGEAIVLPGDANNVRSAAGLNGSRVGSIRGGNRFSVLEGPVCADGYTWWRINANGLIGWTAEGTSSQYWLEPLNPPTPTQTPTLAPTQTSTPVVSTSNINEHSENETETISVSQQLNAEGVIFYETFDDNDAGWITFNDSGQGTDTTMYSNGSYYYDGSVQNGRYEITISVHNNLVTALVPSPVDKPEWVASGNYELSFDFTVLEAHPYIDLMALFDFQEDDDYNAFTYVDTNGRSWYIIASTYQRAVSAQGNADYHLYDGEPHRITVRVEQSSYTVFIDGQELPTQFPPIGESGGRVGFATKFGFYGNTSPTTIKVAFDNVELRQIEDQNPDGENIPFITLIPRLHLLTPPNWHQVRRNPPHLQEHNNDEVYNIEIFNNRQGTLREDDDIRIRLIDPVQVMETTGIIDTREAELNDVLVAYFGSSLGRRTIDTITLADGREALRFSQNNTIWYALRSSDESVVLVGADYAREEGVAEFGDSVESIISTLDYPTPSQNSAQGQAINRLIAAMFSDNPDNVLLEVCAGDAAATLLFIAGVDMMTDVWSGLPSSGGQTLTARQIQSAVVDTSGLYYDVVSEGDGFVRVRLMGNLRLIAPDGTSEIRPMETSIGPVVSRFGQNIYRLEQSDGRWVVCGRAFSF